VLFTPLLHGLQFFISACSSAKQPGEEDLQTSAATTAAFAGGAVLISESSLGDAIAIIRRFLRYHCRERRFQLLPFLVAPLAIGALALGPGPGFCGCCWPWTPLWLRSVSGAARDRFVPDNNALRYRPGVRCRRLLVLSIRYQSLCRCIWILGTPSGWSRAGSLPIQTSRILLYAGYFLVASVGAADLRAGLLLAQNSELEAMEGYGLACASCCSTARFWCCVTRTQLDCGFQRSRRARGGQNMAIAFAGVSAPR